MVVEDSITVVQELGYRYLWVDRHCIDQNDAAGKHATINSMHLVYGNSQLTIIAAAGKDAEYGLPGVGTRAREEQGCVTVGKYSFVNLFPDARTALQRSVWGTRGWTYQEGLLPTRRLIFTEQQVYFQCNTAHYMESVWWPDYLLNSETSPTPVAEWPKPAFQLIGAQRNTDEKVQLLAFLGILGMFSAANPPIYHIWGTPVSQGNCLNKAMPVMWLTCWYHKTPSERRVGFPSWSWSGWTGSIDHTRLRDAGLLEPSYCHSVEIRAEGDDAGTAITLDQGLIEHQAYARYATGSHLLRLRVTRMTEITIRYIMQESAPYVRRPIGRGAHILHRLRHDDGSLDRDALDGMTLPAFQANNFCIVVLWPCGDHYQRAGVFFALDDYILEKPNGSLSWARYDRGDEHRRYYGNFRGVCGFDFHQRDIVLE
ncbi:HET-domain-containing protein [Apiospora sp. TS-2023a]